MKEIIINNDNARGNKFFPLIAGIYITFYGLYQAVIQILAEGLNFNAYLALTTLVLGIIAIVSIKLRSSKPILILNTDSIYIHSTSKRTNYNSEWIKIKEIAIGISYLKMSETDGKTYDIDLSDFKYYDLKLIKNSIIEFCESKNIPYKND